jgi:7-cyano-7-deazaguanine synthase
MDEAQPNAVVLLSGGLDSMVVAGIARERGFALNALTIDYNQRHRREIDAAREIVAALGVARHVVLPLDLRQFGGSALTDEIDVPKDGVVENDIPVTYVPARNLVFLSLTLAWAEALGARDVCIGVNALDYSGYPDCRDAFVRAQGRAIRLALDYKIKIVAPFMHMTKAEEWALAERLGILDVIENETVTCYNGIPGKGCGKCPACRLRRRGYTEFIKSR